MLRKSGITVGFDLATVRPKEISQAQLGFRDSLGKRMGSLRQRESITCREVC